MNWDYDVDVNRDYDVDVNHCMSWFGIVHSGGDAVQARYFLLPSFQSLFLCGYRNQEKNEFLKIS